MEICFKYYQDDYAHLNGSKDMKLKKLDLCRHTMQVGYRNKTSFFSASIYKHLELFFMVMANVDYNYMKGNLILKDEYFALDQSEKVCISYQIGQGLTKAIAESYFNVPWVAHVKTMKNMKYKFSGGGTIKKIIDLNEKSGKEPDLIGFDKNDKAHLFEAKGSSLYSMKNNTVQKAINQVSNYISCTDPIGNNWSFTTRNACLFNFTPCFHGQIIDPPTDNVSENNFIGFLQCLYIYYYNFLYNDNKQLEIIKEFDQKWSGYIFSFGNQKYFWGINSLYREFLREQFTDFSPYSTLQNEYENIRIGNEILNFFNEQESSNHIKYYNDNDNVSIGEDGYVLCNLNKI